MRFACQLKFICRHGFKGDPFYKCDSLVAKEPSNAQDLSESPLVPPLATPRPSSVSLGNASVNQDSVRILDPKLVRILMSVQRRLIDVIELPRVATLLDPMFAVVLKDMLVMVSLVCHMLIKENCQVWISNGLIKTTFFILRSRRHDPGPGNENIRLRGKNLRQRASRKIHTAQKSFSSLLNSHKPYVFKVAFQHCDVQLLDNHTMASTVVVQKHAMFLTNKADSYDLRCQYPIGSRAVESHVNVSELATILR
ncbi:hypothetical protein B9Z55_011425 [Caenorhabditis nigoni]|uniref:ZP domain-containing protein n=1 Tax=Caenorhabditis nigoni TaxID=1611254 RepID=A0A2G5UK11_9PELO|nr:hypothetical protein B9Z55_011425 [Caenorhabditis nigoni]